ncbi:MAG: hypothetical protein KAH67_08600 [Flavobacteriaceae bacterium]|nr:hypothetical protein [Flavobacteriaceae bacterium]
MKTLRIFIFLFSLTIVSYSQSYEGKGDHKINIGYDLYGNGNGIRASYDYGLGDLFSIGAGGSYILDDDDNDYSLFVRTNLHFAHILDLPSKFDIYPGVEVGYLSSNDIKFTGYVGLRYFFTEKIGVFAELGNNGSIGLSLNL